jgi:hypothetical protein
MELLDKILGAITLRHQTLGGGHTRVGRPFQEPGAPEGALRMATIKTERKPAFAEVALCVWNTGLPNPITVLQ